MFRIGSLYKFVIINMVLLIISLIGNIVVFYPFKIKNYGFNSNISFAVLIILFSFQGAFDNFDWFLILFATPRMLIRKEAKKLKSNEIWWAQVESNHRPHAYQACALTAWAMSPSNRSDSVFTFHLATLWWRWGGSNSWPPACKAGALPAELHPHRDILFFRVLNPEN